MTDRAKETYSPRHVAVIMDGNGRWAARRGLPRRAGHRAGASAVRRTVEVAVAMGLEQLTLYVFSTENWRRPKSEVDALMRLFRRFLRQERRTLLKNGVRLRAIGRLENLPRSVAHALADVIEDTRAGSAMTLCLAVNYGGRAELVDAFRKMARDVASGETAADAVDDVLVEERLYQPDMPPLDLIIRTGGEMRLSNFLLWQAAYAEIWVTPVLWPDFGENDLRAAVAAFRYRDRRFGALTATASA